MGRAKIVRITISYKWESQDIPGITRMITRTRFPWLRAHWEALRDRPKWMGNPTAIIIEVEEVRP